MILYFDLKRKIRFEHTKVTTKQLLAKKFIVVGVSLGAWWGWNDSDLAWDLPSVLHPLFRCVITNFKARIIWAFKFGPDRTKSLHCLVLGSYYILHNKFMQWKTLGMLRCLYSQSVSSIFILHKFQVLKQERTH